jgi:DNA-binding SARP family transcriptional activator
MLQICLNERLYCCGMLRRYFFSESEQLVSTYFSIVANHLEERMESFPSPDQDALKERPEASSAVELLVSGFSCIRKGHYSEAVAFFALARERLSPNMVNLVAILDAFTHDHVSYWQAQQALQHASERLVEAHTKQQAHATSLERLLSELLRDTDSNLSAIAPKSPENHHISPSLSEDSRGDRLVPALIGNAPQSDPVNGTQQAEEGITLPALHFTCFGRFEVKRSGQTISLCTNRNGQAILRYMVAQSNHRVTMDTLMGLLWPEDEPEVARHKLQVAISALRRSLNNGYTSDTGGGYILCKNGVYQLNPAVPIRTDVDEFLAFYRAGRQQKSISAAVADYEAACHLYKGAFLTEDLYVDWPIIQREQLNQAYLAMCGALSEHYLEIGSYEDAAKWASAILKENHCDEVAHRQLMRINVAAGRRSEALRQYQRCERILAEELDVSPMSETVSLFHTILSNKSSK